MSKSVFGRKVYIYNDNPIDVDGIICDMDREYEDSVYLLLFFDEFKYEKVVDYINKTYQSFSNTDIAVHFAFGIFHRNLDDQEFMELEKIGKYLKDEYNDELLFAEEDSNSFYYLDELKKADKFTDDFILDIKNSDLSPLEKYLALYTKLQLFYDYKASPNEKNDVDEGRSITSIINLNNEYIVCMGFAALMSYYLDELDILCFEQKVVAGGAHSNNLVYIKDDKYQIEGMYYSDCTWDNSYKDIKLTYAFALVSLFDVDDLELEIYDSEEAVFYDQSYSKTDFAINNDIEVFRKLEILDKYEQINNQILKIKKETNYVEAYKFFYMKLISFGFYDFNEEEIYVPTKLLPDYLFAKYLIDKDVNKLDEALFSLSKRIRNGEFKNMKEEFRNRLKYVRDFSDDLSLVNLEIGIIIDICSSILESEAVEKAAKEKNIYFPGMCIDALTFKNALEVVFKFLKIDDAKEELKNSILRSAEYANQIFSDSSTNTFKKLSLGIDEYKKLRKLFEDLEISIWRINRSINILF